MSSIVSEIANFSIGDLTSRHQIEFYIYWNRLRGSRPCPTRAEINPTEIVKILPYITLIEKVSTDYKVRLMGTYSASIFGEKTGCFLSESSYDACALKQLRSCSDGGAPHFQVRSLKRSNTRYRKSSALATPISSNGKYFDMVALVHDFY